MALAHDVAPRRAVLRTGRRRAKLRVMAFDLGLGDRIRTARLAAGMSQGTLASAVGVSFQQIHKYERDSTFHA